MFHLELKFINLIARHFADELFEDGGEKAARGQNEEGAWGLNGQQVINWEFQKLKFHFLLAKNLPPIENFFY